jgi:peptidyl-tRNA hydrolase
VSVDGAQVRALVPGRVVDLPKEIARLQISGSDLPPDEPGPVPPDVPLLLLNPEVEMTVGKAAAQVGHGTMILASLLEPAELAAWAERGYACAVRTPTVAQWKQWHPGDDPAGAWRTRRVVAVRDAGFTEVAPGTVTVLARYP